MKAKLQKIRRGFTLIELITVTGILAILVALIVPAISSSLDSGKRTRCLGNLRQIGLGVANYGNENNGQLPYVYDSGQAQPFWYDLVGENLDLPSGSWWMDKSGIFRCPAATNSPPSYTMSWAVSGKKVSAVTNAMQRVIIADGPGWDGAGINDSAPFGGLDSKRHKTGASYLMVDGHVEFLREVPTNGLTPLN